jgi:hypothetical protein
MKPQTDDQATTPETTQGKDIVDQDANTPQSPEEVIANNHHELNLKRGRMITSALIVSIILAFIAVAVAGIFQVTGHFLQTCPQELPVNDPSPILWSDITSQKPAPAALGVSEKLRKETALKAQVAGSN